MCIVDRRDDKGAYAPGENRAVVQAALKRQMVEHGPFESTAVPARVEIEQSPSKPGTNGGIPCVTETPGSETLLQLMYERLWGVNGQAT